MLRNYKDGSFGGCSSLSFNNLKKRKLAKQDKVLNKVMDDDSDDEPVELSMDMVNISKNEIMEAGCSPPRKKKRTGENSSDNSTLKAAPKIPRMPFFSWQESDDDIVCHILNADDNKRKGNYRPRKSAYFQIALRNALKPNNKLKMIKHRKLSSVCEEFQISSTSTAKGKTKIYYKVKIGEEQMCTCEFYIKYNTPCKHIISVMINILNLKTDVNLLHQVYLTKAQVRNIFSSESLNGQPTQQKSDDQSRTKLKPKQTIKALLLTTSTRPKPKVDPTMNVNAGRPLPMKPNLPEPQNDPYWLLKREDNIKRCNGCSENTLGDIILGRIELDFYPKVYADGSKQWKVSCCPKYYHADLKCLLERRPDFKINSGDIRIGPNAALKEEVKRKLEL